MATYTTRLPVRSMPTTKRSSRRGKKVSRVIVHHWAGTSGGIERLVHSSDQASANYLILSDGTLIASVPEQYRAWTSGSAAADEPSVTVEVQNVTRGPEWRVSDAAIATLTRLVADVAKRHGWKKITRAQVRGHREFRATACPGPYLYPLLPKIAADAEALRVAEAAPAPGTYTVRRGDTLSAIAAAHGTTVSAIAAASGVRDPNKIVVGQKLVIPATKAKPGWYTVSGLKGADRLRGRSGPSQRHKVKHRRKNGFEIYAVRLVKGDGITWAVTRYGTYYSTGYITKGRKK